MGSFFISDIKGTLPTSQLLNPKRLRVNTRSAASCYRVKATCYKWHLERGRKLSSSENYLCSAAGRSHLKLQQTFLLWRQKLLEPGVAGGAGHGRTRKKLL